jgi:hypothetical protein
MCIAQESKPMSHGQSGKRIQHAGRHRGTSYDYDHHLAEDDSRVLRRAQDKMVVREAVGGLERPEADEDSNPFADVYSEPD